MPDRVTRVVSLVPSITEALATVDRDAIVGATEWCTHPRDLDATRVRGTKNPDLGAVRALFPEVVIANKEENREIDVRRLRAAGVRVEVTEIESVPEAVDTFYYLFEKVLGWSPPPWLPEVRRQWCGPLPPVTRTVAVSIWRDPWMVVGSHTFTSDLLRRLGWENVFASHPERYPHVDPSEVRRTGPDAVLLPDEPYIFTVDDGPEAFPDLRTELISGRLITWYGPSLLEAAELFGGNAHPPGRNAGCEE